MFDQLNLTSAGALLMQQTALGDQLEFTTIKLGDGQQPSDVRLLTDLVSPRNTLDIARAKIVDINSVSLGGNLFPADITENYYWREIGLFARNVTKGTPAVLFSYGWTGNASFISQGGTVTEKAIDIVAQINDAASVVINLDYSNLFPTKQEMSDAIDELDEKVQNDIRSSKNVWDCSVPLGDLPGDIISNITVSQLANMNTSSVGEQSIPNLGDAVINFNSTNSVVGRITGMDASVYQITTTNNSVQAKHVYPNGDWEMWFSDASGGGHYFWDQATQTLRFQGFNTSDTDPVVYEIFAGNAGGPNFDTTGGTRNGSRIITAWSGSAPGQGELSVYYTKNRPDTTVTSGDEIVNQDWVKSYVLDNVGIFVGTVPSLAVGQQMTDTIAQTAPGFPVGHTLSNRDIVYVQDDANHQEFKTLYVRGVTNSWVFGGVIGEDIPGVDNTTIEIFNGVYRVKPGANLQVGAGTITDAGIGTRTVTAPAASDPTAGNAITGNLTQILQTLANQIKWLSDRTVKAAPENSTPQKIHMYVQDNPPTSEPGVTKIRIPITDN